MCYFRTGCTGADEPLLQRGLPKGGGAVSERRALNKKEQHAFDLAPTPGGVKMNFRNGLEAMTPTWQVECGDLRGSFRARSVAAVLARALLAHHRLSPLVRFRRPTGPGRWIWQYQETAHLLRQHREER